MPAILFALFVVLAVVVPHVAAAKRRAALNLFLGFALFAGLAAGFLHREMWPFSRWLVFAYPDIPHSDLNLRAVTASGKEYELDARALEPFNPVELYTWLSEDFPQLSPPHKDQAAEHLLKLAEKGRQRAVRGEAIGEFGRYFGPVAAPSHFLFARKWNDPANISSEPFVGFKIYEDRWEIEQRRVDPSAFQHKLIYELTPKR
jgi:hypothetical protein